MFYALGLQGKPLEFIMFSFGHTMISVVRISSDEFRTSRMGFGQVRMSLGLGFRASGQPI